MIPVPIKRRKKKGRTLTLAELDGGQAEGVVDDSAELDGSASKQILSRGIAHVLEKHYPGWNWGIQVDEKGGVVNIFALLLSGDMGYTILLADLHQDVNLKRILIAGGEILERFGCRRGPFTPEQFQRINRAPNGTPMPDVTDKDRPMQRMVGKRGGTADAR